MHEEKPPTPNAVLPEELLLLKAEEEELNRTLHSLAAQLRAKEGSLGEEDRRSRLLTAELVAATRDEDKQLLASDEAVSHALKTHHSAAAGALTTLLKKPYFARFGIEEEHDGRVKQFEYKLGTASNPECRIIDWRESPLAKLYYEYQAGDEYSEEIQGVEREGRIIFKHPIQIENGELKSVTTKFGTFSAKRDNTSQELAWERSKSQRKAGSGMRDILSLITDEQFRTITERAKTAVLLQGVAGSGKTTIALHRLAWLLHQKNSDLRDEECGVIVRNPILAEFIRGNLKALHIDDVPVLTFQEWEEKVFAKLSPSLTTNTAPIGVTPPKGLFLSVQGEGYLHLFESKLQELSNWTEENPLNRFLSLLRAVFTEARAQPEGKTFLPVVLNSELFDYLAACEREGHLPPLLRTSFLRFLLQQEKHRAALLGPPVQFRHLVIDELQDYSPIALACLINSVRETSALTLVGDVGQAIDPTHDFVGWERLKKVWNIELGEEAKFFSLEVSHRSTLPIMQLASFIAERPAPRDGRQGRVPIWFHSDNEEGALRSTIGWLEKALERYPDCLTSVLCTTAEEAAQVYSLLKPRFSPLLRHWQGRSISFEEGLVVATLDQVKGLEFTNTVLWNVSAKTFPHGDRTAKNLLYVGMTRAEENLAIITWGRPSPLLPKEKRSLLRLYDLRPEREEESGQSIR